MSIESREQCLDTIMASAAEIQAAQQAAHRRPAHAERDLEIFKRVVIEGCTHAEVAAQYELDRSRVTQIVADVRRQLAQAAAEDPEIKNFYARQRLDSEVEKMRFEYALQAAALAISRDKSILTTHRAGSRDKDGRKEGWSETVQRDAPTNMRPINTYFRVTRALSQLRQIEANELPLETSLSEEDMFFAVCVVLEDWQWRGFDRDDPPSEAFIELIRSFACKVLSWVGSRRRGSSRHDAWPEPADARVKHRAAEDSNSGEIHRSASEINTALTTPGNFSGAVTPPAQAT